MTNKNFTEEFYGDNPFSDILGQEATKKQLKSALLMGRNVIIVGPPGVGKTTMAKNIAKLVPGETPVFVRVQGSPDLTVEDLMGDIDPVKALKYGPSSLEAFTPGKIFKADKGVLFFDEVNRCPEKLQNALLQALEERTVTLGGYDIDFPAKFVFIGTMNPEDSNTEKLSDVFLDRFDMVYMGYPDTHELEEEIVHKRAKEVDVDFSKELFSIAIAFVRALRESRDLEKKPSVRASIGLVERARSNAVIEKNSSVTYQNLKDAVNSVIAHSIRLKPSLRYVKDSHDFIREQFEIFTRNFESEDSGGDG